MDFGKVTPRNAMGTLIEFPAQARVAKMVADLEKNAKGVSSNGLHAAGAVDMLLAVLLTGMPECAVVTTSKGGIHITPVPVGAAPRA